MTLITFKLTLEELELMTTLVSDQLFRREFIDPKMPGHKSNSEEMKLGKALVARMKLLADPESAKKIQRPTITHLTIPEGA